MYDTFIRRQGDDYQITYSPKLLTGYDQLRDGIEKFTDRVKGSRHVDNRSPLLRLLLSIDLPFDLSDRELYEYGQEKGEIYARTLGLWTEQQSGRVLNTILNTSDVDEYIQCRRNGYPESISALNWDEYCAMQWHRHPMRELTLPNLDKGRPNDFMAVGPAVISIDVGLLLIQYRYWYRQVDPNNTIDKTTQGFVFDYVCLPSLRSYYNVVCFNLFIGVHLDNLYLPGVLHSHFAVANPGVNLINGAREILRGIYTKDLYVGDYLSLIKLPFDKLNAHAMFPSVENKPRTQLIPLHWMERADAWCFVLSLSQTYHHRRNRRSVDMLKRRMKEIEQMHISNFQLDLDLGDIQEYFE